SPYLIALCLALGMPDPNVGNEGSNDLDIKIGQAAGEALKGDLTNARSILEKIDYGPDKWRALVIVSCIAPKNNPLINEAVDLFEKEVNDKPLSPWLVYQAVQSGLEAGISADRLQGLVAAIADEGIKGQA